MKKDNQFTNSNWEEENLQGPRKMNKKKIILATIVACILLTIIVIAVMYATNENFRNRMDTYVLMKSVQENNLPYISLEEDKNYEIYAMDQYIAVLNQNELSFYTSTGKKEATQTVEITTPLVESNGKYMVLADKEKQQIYVFSGTNKQWETKLEGNISRVQINQNGYVAVVLTGTAYKSVIQIYNTEGKQLFTTYLSKSMATDIEISKDNQYLSFVEVDTSGTLLQTYIKTISISKAQEDPDSIIYTYTAPTNSINTKIKYQTGNKLVCMYNNEIHVMYEGKDETITTLKDSENKFADINLEKHIVKIIEKNVLLSAQTKVEIINIDSKTTSSYTVQGTVKELYTRNDTTAINLGSEVCFIGNNGWLKKKYTSTQEIKKIIICNNFAGIVYRDKIELVSL